MGRPKGSKNKPKLPQSGEPLTPSGLSSPTEKPQPLTTDELRSTATSMAALAVGKDVIHPWWRLAQAMLAVLDSGNQEAIKTAREAFVPKRRGGTNGITDEVH